MASGRRLAKVGVERKAASGPSLQRQRGCVPPDACDGWRDGCGGRAVLVAGVSAPGSPRTLPSLHRGAFTQRLAGTWAGAARATRSKQTSSSGFSRYSDGDSNFRIN